MYAEKEKGSAVTWMVTVIRLGQVVGQLLGGYLGPSLGWRFPFHRFSPCRASSPFHSHYFFVTGPGAAQRRSRSRLC